MKKKYWAVGLNFDYTIISDEFAAQDYGSVEGPFRNLAEAKKQIREWVRNDRETLALTLREAMELKEGDIK